MATNATYQFDRINFPSTIASELERYFHPTQTPHLRKQLYAGLRALSGAVHLGKIRHRDGGRNGRLLTADSWGGGELDAKVEVDRDK
ncbi:hypothetical protein QT995_26975 [Microcoleus sp. S36b_A3]|uniref:hypothetical protein n=1 Tax=unclassified Microcoleus TaxID=2642155 RepID=UPI002FD34F11